MTKKKFDLIVFDWDGTLMDSTATIVRCIQSAAQDLGLTPPTREAASHVIGLGLQDALQKAVPELDPKDYARMVERYRHYYFSRDEDLVLFDGVREMLETLRKQNYFLAVATGKSRSGLDRAMYSVELTEMFDATRCADETFSKPHPAMLQELTRDLGMEMERTVMIGDTTHDLQMALNAGASGVAVHYGAHTPQELSMMNPLYGADTVADLQGWLLTNA